MTSYVLRRLVQFVPTFVGVTIITFIILRLAPGDPGDMLLQGEGGFAPESLAAWRELRGLDDPLLVQYFRWLGALLRFDFGRSLIDERLVSEIIWEAIPASALVTGSALVCVYATAIPLGVYSAVRRGTWIDGLLSTSLFALYSLPIFWVALLLIVFLGGGEFLNVFPIRGLQSEGAESSGLLWRGVDLVWHLVLPVGCLTYPAMARTSRFQRSAMLDVIHQSYIRTARAKGLSERRVILKHALKNSLLPVVTLLSVDLPWLIGGSVIIERIFTIHGMGMLTFAAILERNYPIIMGVTALVALVTMTAVLLGDLALLWLDPRLRLNGSGAARGPQ